MHSPPPPRERCRLLDSRRTYTAVNARGGGVRMQDHASFCLRHHHHHQHGIFALDVQQKRRAVEREKERERGQHTAELARADTCRIASQPVSYSLQLSWENSSRR
uniref:Uncharacterized protein n=1 Tax=Trichogramma kaykai TaxID=54128 RepID=A0ABD2XR49_9HYME